MRSSSSSTARDRCVPGSRRSAYDALCAKGESELDSVCRSLGDQARCGLARGLKPKAVVVARDGKTAELVVKSPGDELAVFVVKAMKVGKDWRVDGVRCPATLDNSKDTRTVPGPVKAALSAIKPRAALHIGTGWPAYAELLPPDPGVADPAWFLPDETCHVKDGSKAAPAPAGPYLMTKRGIAAVVRNNAGERYVAYFERDMLTGKLKLTDARCAMQLAG